MEQWNRYGLSLAWASTISSAILACLLCATAAHAQLGFTHRLTTVLYDYDNNGTTDATSTFTYDANGRATTTSYVYTGDGTPDLFVTEDDDAAQEDGTITHNANDLVDSVSVDRQLMVSGTEEFDTALTFTGGVLTRVDSDSVFQGGTNATFTSLSYVGGQLDQIEERNDSDNSLVFEQSYMYGGNNLPSVVTFDSAGIDAVTNFTWRSDGQVDDVSSTSTFGGNPLGSGAGDYVYDAGGFLQSEAWSFTGSVGSFFAEFQGAAYRKTYSYDAQQLKTLEQIDIGDNGSVEATRTYVWTAGSCVPAFIFASNGRPNFAQMSGLPYVPGTGATWFENCGPVVIASAAPAVPRVFEVFLLACLGAVGAWQLQRRTRLGELRAG